MSKILDKETGFEFIDSAEKVFADNKVLLSNVKKALEPMILSASGWRKVFALGGDEESTTEEISIEDKVLVGAMAQVFSDFVKKQTGVSQPEIVLSQDSRHTGSVIADTMIRVFLANKISI